MRLQDRANVFKSMTWGEVVESADDKIGGWISGVFAAATDPLLRGDLLAYAKAKYPPEQYPTAWQDVPEDLRHGLVWEGKLLNGDDVAEMAKSQITDEHVSKLIRKSAKRAAILCFLLLLFIPLTQGLLAIQGGGGIGLIGLFVPYAQSADYPTWAAEAGAWLPVASWWLLLAIEKVWMLVSVVLSYGLPLLALFAVFWFYGFNAGMSRLWEGVSAPLRVATRDAAILWKSNTTTRQNDITAYRRQVAYATTALAGMPTFKLGTGTGLLAARGDRRAPARGQTVALDAHSMRQHGGFFGPTGAQKTTLGIDPIFRKVMNAVWGINHKIGAFVMDGKGGLWRDLMRHVAHRDDVRVIGLGDDQYGVDLLASMAPHEIGLTYTGVLGQISGDSKQDFWTRSSSDLIVQAATVAQALAYDEETVAEWIDEYACHPYSLISIMLMATEQPVIEAAIQKLKDNAPHLNDKLNDAQKVEYKAAYDSAAWFIGNFWGTLAKDTRSGIIQTLTSVLSPLRGERELMRRFGAGTYHNTIDVHYALEGGVVMVAMGPQTSLGNKLVTCWLKSRLYIMALRRYEENPEQCKNSSCIMIADEFQSLVTTGHDSDKDFWNRARSSGLFLWMATQSLAAIEQIIGEVGTKNLMDCINTKVFFSTRELSTINYIREIAGDSYRGLDADNIYSTYAARKMALGDEGEAVISLGLAGGWWPSGFSAPTWQNNPYSTAALWNVVRQMNTQEKHGTSLQLATRNEDRNRAAFIEGVTMQPKLDKDDLKMGSGLAFAIWMRAGVSNMDVIDLIDEEAA